MGEKSKPTKLYSVQTLFVTRKFGAGQYCETIWYYFQDLVIGPESIENPILASFLKEKFIKKSPAGLSNPLEKTQIVS